MMMKVRTRTHWIGTAALVGAWVATAACTGAEADDPALSTAEALSAAQTAPSEDRIEEAVRDIESGRHDDKTRAALEAILQNRATTADQRDDARLALSRWHELAGDKEQAVRSVEQVLAAHSDGARYAARSRAEERLRLLLTGRTEESPRLPAENNVAPVAKSLAKYFTPGADGTTRVEILIFGRPPEEGEPLGSFNIAGALQDNAREACPLCNDSVSVSTSRSQHGSWTAIPAAAAIDREDGLSLGTALNVFYFDLDTNRIPSRYDAHLPVPSEEIAAHLEKGEGLIAVKQREGAPPVILLAAPRWAMLQEVEEVFSKMASLPTEPTSVPLSPNLRPKEIQAVVRGAYPRLRQCYESHLTANPDARGKMVMAFSITGDGSSSDVELAEESTLDDPGLWACFRTEFERLKFPASGRLMTVRYPIALAPDQE